jgi:metal-responsive CopG/Arc/MetJ family transcriptional regulator
MNQKCNPKKRICITLSEQALEILDRDKQTKYTKGRSQVVEEWAEEKRELELKQ